MKKEKIILIVNGNLSVKKNFIDFLKKYDSILCVDGAANKIINLGIKPDYILGDLDSINKINIRKYSQNLIKLENQNYNDLHKTLLWAKEKNIKNIDIIGIDGKRIDHTIGNFNIILECISFPLIFESLTEKFLFFISSNSCIKLKRLIISAFSESFSIVVILLSIGNLLLISIVSFLYKLQISISL